MINDHDGTNISRMGLIVCKASEQHNTCLEEKISLITINVTVLYHIFYTIIVFLFSGGENILTV